MIGVSMSTKPSASISCRMIDVARARVRMLRCIRSRRRSSQRYLMRSPSSTPSSSSWNGSGVLVDRIFSSSTCTSTSPVGMFGLTVSGERATTSPVA